jgi:DNA modification methylase
MEVRGKPRNKGRKKSVAQTDKTCYGNYGAAELYNNEYYPKSIITKSNGNRTDNRFHSTMKPVSLIEYLILTYSDVGDVVLDSCCGSCSTGVAAHRTGRKFIGFELDEEYYKLSKQRLDEEMSQMTIYDLIETP